VNLLKLSKWSIVVVDPKGELARLTGGEREKCGTVYYLNPYGVCGLRSTFYNPLLSLDSSQDHFVDDAMRLAEAIVSMEGKDPHWSASAQDLLCSLIMYTLLSDKEGSGTLRHIRDCLGKSAEEFRAIVGDMRVEGTIKDWDELTVKASRFLDIDPENKELNSILSTALTQTRWIDSRAIKTHTDEGFINWRELKQRPITVYLMLPANRLVTQSKWLRMVLTAIIQALMDDASQGAVPVLLALEEAAALGHLPIVEDTMAMMRGYGIKLWSIFQDLSQLEDIYQKRYESFIANAGVLQAFAPRDMRTAKMLSDLSGQRTEYIENRQASQGLSGFSLKGLSFSQSAGTPNRGRSAARLDADGRGLYGAVFP
jgi:type IV secretion system protein VirD4